MNCAPIVARCYVDLVRISLGIGDELGNRLSWKRLTDLHDHGVASNPRNRRNVANEIKTQLVVERCTDRVMRTDQQNCIAIGGRVNDRLGSANAATSRPVLNYELMVEALREPLGNQTRYDIGRATSLKPDYDAHRPRRIGLRARDAR